MNGTPRKKSPRAPSIALDEALDRALRAYQKERLHAAPTEVVAQNIGYKGANSGTALSALASLRYFGLLERPKEGFLAVSKDVETYQFAPDEAQRRASLVGFLKKPPLFSDLLERFPSGLPSEANLRFDLIQRGFAPAAADSATSAFIRSVDFVGYFDKAVTEPQTENGVETRQPVEDSPSQLEETPARTGLTPAAPSMAIGNAGDDFDRIPVRLHGGRRAWLLIPTPFFDADKIRLKAQIDLVLTQDEEAGR